MENGRQVSQKIELLKIFNLFSKFKLIIKVIVVFYEISKIQPGKTKFSSKILTSKMLKVQILAI